MQHEKFHIKQKTLSLKPKLPYLDFFWNKQPGICGTATFHPKRENFKIGKKNYTLIWN